jgi:NADH-quinone oxidoreductase subunit N
MTPAVVPARDFLYLAPHVVLTIGGLVALLADLGWLRRRPEESRRKAIGSIALGAVLLALVASIYDVPGLFGFDSTDTDPYLFFGTISNDLAAVWLGRLVLVLLALVVSISMAWPFTKAWGEYFALLIWAAVGMLFLIAAEELLTLFLALEMMTLCLYLAAAFETDRPRSPEAGLKYFIYGSVSSALFLFGLSLIYGLTGTTRLDAIHQVLTAGRYPGLTSNLIGAVSVVLILAGFGFKVAAVPFHQWAPDAYEGAPAPVAAWIASGSKVASFAALLKVFAFALAAWAAPLSRPMEPGWLGLLAVVSAITMTYGNMAALVQTNFKRMLGYSAIAHAGYLLLGVAAVAVRPGDSASAGAVLFYLVVYAITKAGAFALAAWCARDCGGDAVSDLNGLGTRSPFLAACITVVLLSLIGVPPLAGFFGKLFMFMAALNSDEVGGMSLTWLVVLAIVNTVISARYYVRVLVAMYLRPAPASAGTGVEADRFASSPPASLVVPIVLSAVAAIGFGLGATPLLETMNGASAPLLSPRAGAGFDRAAVREPETAPHPMPVLDPAAAASRTTAG